MDVINIHKWSNQQVLNWFKGLDDSLQRYELNFKNAGVVGRQLLNLSYNDLQSLRISVIGHQELILDAVSLLQQLDYGLDSETLQSRALCLKCRCRGIRSGIAARRKEAEDYEYDGGQSLQRGASNQLLLQASDVLNEGKQLILWLDRSPFNNKQTFQASRMKLVELCYELSVTMQQSVFACVIEDAALNICNEMENCADGIVQSNDSITIQPVSLEQVHLRDVSPTEGLGIFIKATFEGHHVVTGTRKGSVASRARKIFSGDEVVAVNGTVVVGWSLNALVSALKEQPYEVNLLMKKRPQVQRSSSASNLLAVLQRTEKDRSKIFRVATPIKRIRDPSNPIHQAPAYENQRSSNPRLSSGTWSSNRSRDVAEEMSQTSSSGISDRLESSNTFESQRSGQKPKAVETTKRSSRISQQVSVEVSSPMEVLKFPPPPSIPYTPNDMYLNVQQTPSYRGSNRSASPNSLLDIDHTRRYTVIGGSTVDQRWYEDFLSQVNKCHFNSPNKQISQEKLSSNEEVFIKSNPHRPPPSSTTHEKVLRHRPSKPSRPMSMPPNYYLPPHSHPSALPLHTSAMCNSCQESSVPNKSSYRQSSNHSSQFDFPPGRYYNSNYNNNSPSSRLMSPDRGKSAKAPPKPPPRSSSITKLSHPPSSEQQQRINHPRQSSLPEKNVLSVHDKEKRYSAGEKPALARKPTGVHQPKKSFFTKSSRSSSTPHLQQSSRHQLPALSDNNQKDLNRIKDNSVSEVTYRGSPQLSQYTTSSVDSNSPRPVPKPRTIRKKAIDKEIAVNLLKNRSGSDGNLLDLETRRNIEARPRRKSACHVPQKQKQEDFVGTASPRLQSLARSSPTRLSYSSAISSNQDSSVDVDLRSGDVPQPNDHYEVRVIAGVPVRLRKSFTRLTGNKLKVPKTPPEKDKAKTSRSLSEMKGERRVSCRDLGKGDCQGWLWKKKTGADLASNGPLASKWSKRYVVIKNRAIYCYKESSIESDQKAECYIGLPGYTVAPATESKRKFAFRITHLKRKTFFFAAERQTDMSRWMNKMGLAAIEYKYDLEKANGDVSKLKDNDYYSESEEDFVNDDTVAESSSSSSSMLSESVFSEKQGGPPLNRHLTTGALLPNISESATGRSKSESDVLEGGRESVSNRSVFSNVEDSRGSVDVEEDSLSDSGLFDVSTSLNSLIINIQGIHATSSFPQTDKYSNAETYKSKVSSSNLHTLVEDQPDEKSLDESAFVGKDRSTSSRSMKPSVSVPVLVKSEDPVEKQSPIVRRRPAKSEPPPSTFAKKQSGNLDQFSRLRQSIKSAEVDILGGSRKKTTLRRKMTILAPDPQMNERMLRKRALERELKAKELELAYFDKLLNKNKITHSELHSWINQHPSLFAEIGTIRRMSKIKRPPPAHTAASDPPGGGDVARLSDSSLTSTTDSGKNSHYSVNSVNSNNSNNRYLPSSENRLKPVAGARPRSSAMSSADLNPPADSDQNDPKSRTLPSQRISSHRRRKLPPNRPFPTQFTGDKPYLETDL